MLQMAMLLCMGMLTIGHRKASQLGEVRISFHWDSTASQEANRRQKDQQTDRQTEHQRMIGSRAKAKGTAASYLCSPAPPLPLFTMHHRLSDNPMISIF